jgi:hypothetical protein
MSRSEEFDLAILSVREGKATLRFLSVYSIAVLCD